MRKQIAIWITFLSGIGVIVYILLTKDVTKPIPAVIVATCVNIISVPLYVGIVESIYWLKNLVLVFKTQIVYRTSMHSGI